METPFPCSCHTIIGRGLYFFCPCGHFCDPHTFNCWPRAPRPGPVLPRLRPASLLRILGSLFSSLLSPACASESTQASRPHRRPVPSPSKHPTRPAVRGAVLSLSPGGPDHSQHRLSRGRGPFRCDDLDTRPSSKSLLENRAGTGSRWQLILGNDGQRVPGTCRLSVSTCKPHGA